MPVCAIALTWPPCTRPTDAEPLEKKYFTWPATTSFSASAAAAIGDVVDRHLGHEPQQLQAEMLQRAVAGRGEVEPAGAFLASSMMSATVFASTDGVTTRMFGTSEARDTGWKSLA